MALISCPECNRQVSDKAEACINCGCPLNKNTTVTCPECKNKISDNSTSCPSCGLPNPGTVLVKNIIKPDILTSKDLSNICKKILDKISRLNDSDRSHLDKIGDISFCDFIDNVKNIESDRKYSSINKRIEAALMFESELDKAINPVNEKPVEVPQIINNKIGISINDYDRQSAVNNQNGPTPELPVDLTIRNEITSAQIKKAQFMGRLTIVTILLILVGSIISRSSLSLGDFGLSSFSTSPKTVLKRHLGNSNLEVVEATGIGSCYWFDDHNQNLNNRISGFAKIQNGEVIKLNYYYTNLKVGAIETCKGREYVSPIDDVFSGRGVRQ